MVELFDLSINKLSGTIPSLSALTQLQNFNLFQNELIGELPSGIGCALSLSFVDVSYNSLSGTVPSQLSSLSNLQRLWVNDNRLVGTVSDLLSRLTQLISAQLQNNFFVGTLPAWNSSYALTSLSVANNSLTGTLPPYICRLQDVDVRNNVRERLNNLFG
tara:strand:- start:661 stop:1140 length:480 start_codon:yes stop_codon:yes gene_type:complete